MEAVSVSHEVLGIRFSRLWLRGGGGLALLPRAMECAVMKWLKESVNNDCDWWSLTLGLPYFVPRRARAMMKVRNTTTTQLWAVAAQRPRRSIARAMETTDNREQKTGSRGVQER